MGNQPTGKDNIGRTPSRVAHLLDEECKEERKLEGEADIVGAPDKSEAVDVEPAVSIEIA